MLHAEPAIKTPEPRRLATLSAAPEVMLGLLHYLNEDGRRITQTGLPPDAKVVGADYDSARRCFRFVLESEQFEPIVQGAVMPELYVAFTEHREAIT